MGDDEFRLDRARLIGLWHSAVALVRRSDIALGYAAIVIVIAIVLAVVPDQTHDRLILQSSTNLANLRERPLLVLIASAFVVSSLASLWQIPFLLLLYAAAQRWVGPAGTIFAAALGHIGATLFVATLLASGIAHGWLQRSIARTSDVGVSYGLACLAAFLVMQVPRHWRLPYVVVVLVYFVSPLLFDPNFTSVGHTTALAIGFGLALLAARVTKAARE
jgi:hypothetical protein